LGILSVVFPVNFANQPILPKILIKIKKKPVNKISFLFQLKVGIFSFGLAWLIAGSSAGFF